MKTKRQIQKEHTRRNIIDTAYKVYSDHGFTAPTSNIASEAGVSHGTIFVHFPSLNNLIYSLVKDFGETIREETRSLADDGKNLEMFLKSHLAIIAKYEAFYTRLISEKSMLSSQAQLDLFNTQGVIAQHFKEVYLKEKEAGLTVELPSHILFNTWLGLVHYYLQNKAIFSPDEPLIPRYSDELVSSFLVMLQK